MECVRSICKISFCVFNISSNVFSTLANRSSVMVACGIV